MHDRTESVYAKELEHELLSEYEEYQLLRDAQSGDENAREKLLLLNLRLVRSVVQKYENPQLKVFADDLMADGVIGLHNAISNYDISFRTRLSTYAVIAIHRAVARSPLLHSSIRLPEYVRAQVRAINRAKAILYSEDRPVTVQSISELSDLSIECVEQLCCLDVEKDTVQTFSLENSIGSENDSVRLLDTIVDENAELAYEQVDLEITLEYFLSKLDACDRFIVERSYGIPIKLTQAEICKIVGCSSEGVRYKLDRAMTQLQRLARALRGSVDEIKEALETPYAVMAGNEETSEKTPVLMTGDEKTIPLFPVSENQIDISRKPIRCKRRDKVDRDTN